MLIRNATDVRKDWSAVMESAIREKPQFIKRTRDYMVLADVKIMENLLSAYSHTADVYTEEDGSVTISLNELDLVENAATEEQAKLQLGKSIMEYSKEFYNEFAYWSAAPNRKSHIPYVLKALIQNDAKKIADSIQCRPGEN